MEAPSSREEANAAGADGQRIFGVPRWVVAATCLLFALFMYLWLRHHILSAECDWSSPVGSLDSSHSFVEGTAPYYGRLFLATTGLLTLGSLLFLPRWWMWAIAFVPLWLVSVLVVFVAQPVPCRV